MNGGDAKNLLRELVLAAMRAHQAEDADDVVGATVIPDTAVTEAAGIEGGEHYYIRLDSALQALRTGGQLEPDPETDKRLANAVGIVEAHKITQWGIEWLRGVGEIG
jgi:hypothetical protein